MGMIVMKGPSTCPILFAQNLRTDRCFTRVLQTEPGTPAAAAAADAEKDDFRSTAPRATSAVRRTPERPGATSPVLSP